MKDQMFVVAIAVITMFCFIASFSHSQEPASTKTAVEEGKSEPEVGEMKTYADLAYVLIRGIDYTRYLPPSYSKLDCYLLLTKITKWDKKWGPTDEFNEDEFLMKPPFPITAADLTKEGMIARLKDYLEIVPDSVIVPMAAVSPGSPRNK